ncbi:MAG: tol-pal system protein YbgF [Burkholderiales bacterium]|nr:tol-pal system protein YbgF [Burkholderiales bacterium]
MSGALDTSAAVPRFAHARGGLLRRAGGAARSVHPASLRSVVAIAAFICVVPAPASSALFDDDEARRQIAVERKRVDDVSARISAQTEQLGAISGRIGKLEEALGKNQALLDLFREIENLKTELARMRGQLEVVNNNIETAQKRQQDFYVDLDTRLRRIETASVPPHSGASPSAPGDAAAGGAKAGPAGVPAATSTAEMRAYEAAQNLRRIGNYQGAIVAFQSFVKQYPKSPLAPSAQYWIGDSYFNMRDFRLAIASQRLLLASYPESAKVPDALLNIASAQAEMGETATARKTMDELVAKHPSSEAAEKARRRLATSR